MDIEARNFFGEFGQLMKEWIVAAFFAGTNDWVFSKIPVRNGIFATILSIFQLTCAFYATTWGCDLFGSSGAKTLYFGDNWLAFNTIIIMSPTAIQRLTSSYYKLHLILYGPGRIPTTSDCTTGNCTPTTQAKTENPMREKAEEIVPVRTGRLAALRAKSTR